MTLLELCGFWENVTKRRYMCVCVCVCACVHFRNIILQTHRRFPNILEHYSAEWLIFYTNSHTKAYTISVYASYVFTSLLTPWCTVLLRKLTGSQLVKKFPAFYGTPYVHYRFHKCPPPVPILNQLDPVHTCRSILILFSHLRLGLPSCLVPSRFPTKTLYTPLLSPIRANLWVHFYVQRIYLFKCN